MNYYKLFKTMFFFITGTAYTYAVVLSVLNSTVLGISPLWLISACAAAVICCSIFFHNKTTIIVTGCVLLLFALFTFCNIKFFDYWPLWYLNLERNAREIFSFIKGARPYDESYDTPIAVMLVFAVALIAVLNIKMRYGFYILSLFGFSIILMPYIMGFIRKSEPIIIFTFCFLCFLTKYLHGKAASVKNIPRKTQTTGNNENKTAQNIAPAYKNAVFSVFVIPVILLFVFTASLLPAPGYRGLSFSQGSIFQAGSDVLYTAFNPSRFSFDITGFSGKDGRLGGKVTATGNFVMNVYADERLYLTGAVKSLYTGYSWAEPDVIETRLSDFDAHIYNLTDSPPQSETKTARINISGARTTSVFLPPLTSRIEFNRPVTLIKTSKNEYYTQTLMRSGAEYAIDYTTLVIPVTATYGERAFLFSAAPEVDSKYLELPDNIPHRVYELAFEITKNGRSNYDKIRLLEEYIRSFPYTLEPADVPYDADFVDFFLFEGKEGYCTYYASALAVMGRMVGVPTRYVEGYLLPPEPNAHGAYRVTTYNAHAWAEAYIGDLWVTFEPTAPFADAAPVPVLIRETQTPDPASVEEPQRNEPNLAPSMRNEQYSDYLRQMGFTDEEETPENIQTPHPRPKTAQERFEARKRILIRALITVLALCVLAALILGVSAFVRFIRFNKLNKCDNRTAAIEYFKLILKIAAIFGYPLERTETANTYAKRIGKRFAFYNQQVFISHLAAVFGKAAYGTCEISGDELNLMRGCYLEFMDMLIMYRISKPRFLAYKYILHRI